MCLGWLLPSRDSGIVMNLGSTWMQLSVCLRAGRHHAAQIRVTEGLKQGA